MNNDQWQLQEAKSRFSELVETVLLKGAQTVTKHGKPAVVVISAEEYQQHFIPRRSFAEALRACPEELAPLIGKRAKRVARTIDFQ
jgi:prevent-host-death family protein